MPTWRDATAYTDKLLKENPAGHEWLEGHSYLMRCFNCGRKRWYDKAFVKNPFANCFCIATITLWVAVDYSKVILDMANKGETDEPEIARTGGGDSGTDP